MASYEKRGKFWTVRFRYINEYGLEVNKRLSQDELNNKFETKKEAEQAYINFLSTIKPRKKQEKPTFKYFIELYNDFLEYRKNRVKQSTYYNVLYLYQEHVLPYFSNYKLSDITPQVINKWQQNLEKYSYKYKTKIRGYFKIILEYGEKYYNTPNNMKLCENFTKVTAINKEMQIWTPDEFNIFINQISDLKDKTMFNFLYLMGTRKGELGALQWADINFENKTCTISKTLTRLKGELKLGNSTKNYKKRILIIPNKLLELLILLKQQLLANNKFSENWFVFGTETKYLTYTPLATKFNKYYKLALQNYPNLKYIRIHDFRHSHVSLLINQAQSNLGLTALLYSIAERLGDTVEQVLKTYGHLFPNKQKELVDTLNSI